MLKNYLLITFRSLMKNKLFILINVLGMGTSIACSIVAYFNYDYNARFDSNHRQASTIYRVNSTRVFQGEERVFGFVPVALGNVIRQNIPDATVIRYSLGNGNFRVGTDIYENGMSYVDRTFFKTFTYEFIEGNGDLSNKDQVCISDALAMKLFNTKTVVGKPLTQVLDSGKIREFIIAGVFKQQPDNSSFYFRSSLSGELFVEYDNYFDKDQTSFEAGLSENSWKYRNTLFLQVKDPARVAGIEKQIKPYTANNNKIREDFILKEWKLDPFPGMGVRDGYEDKPGTWTHSGSPIAAIVGIAVMAIFVLLIACFNMTNTAVAISSKRLKEIGLRKVMGSSRMHLIFQFIGETTLICFLALIVGLLIAEYLLIPSFNTLWTDLKIVSDYWGSPDFILFLGATLIFVSLLAGGYPSFYISKFQPTSILKGTLKFGGTNYFTRILLMLQLTISLIAIVCSLAFIDNAKFQKNFNMGFDKNGLVYTRVNNRAEFEIYRNALAGNPDIGSIAGSQHHLFSSSFNDPVKHEDKEIEVDILDVGEDYLTVVGLTLTAGRNFEKDSETDRKESVIITEGLARKFDLKDPIGKQITWMDTTKYYVVGVVKDIYNRGLWEQMEPVMFRYGSKEKVNHILVAASGEKLSAVNAFMETKWKEIFPNRLYNGRFMDSEIVEANTINNNLVIMFIFLGGVALVLATTGLYTLVSLNIIKKMKEIGVRKVLGASFANLARVINKEFIIMVVLAMVLGGYAGTAMSGLLMRSIWKYYQGATMLTLVIAAATLLLTCIVSIAYKVYSTTRLNPAKVLRTE